MSDNQKLSPWQKYKQNLGETRPWDMLNSDNFVDNEISEQRFAICKECPFFISTTTQCKKCGCIMKAKTKLIKAECPEHKW